MRQFLIYRLRKIRWSIALGLLLAALVYATQGTAPLPPSTDLLSQPGIEAPLWTATKAMTAQENAMAHFKKHGHEMGFENAADYVRAAQSFLRAPPEGTETKIEHDGDILRYNERTGQFGVMRRDGAPRTFFIPDKDDPSAASNRAYFDRQD